MGFPIRTYSVPVGGLLYKQGFPGFTYDQVFDYALSDYQKNYEERARFFREH